MVGLLRVDLQPPTWGHSVMVSATGFDPVCLGSIPGVLTNRSEDALMGVCGTMVKLPRYRGTCKHRAMGLYTASDNMVGTLAPRKGRKDNMIAIIGFLLMVIIIEFWYESNK